MRTKESFPYIALYVTAIAAGSLVSFLFKFFTDNPYSFWNVVVPSAIAVAIVDVLNRRKRRKEEKSLK